MGPSARRAAGPRAVPAALAAVALAAGLAACTPSVDGGWSEDGGETGYVTGDELTLWEAGDRKGPVDLAGTDYAGAPVDLSAWRGDVVVLNTWYASCPPCRAEAPDLVELATDYADRGVRVLGINGTDDAGAAQAYERTFDVPYPSLHDVDGAAVAALQGVVPVRAVPTTVVLDRDGGVAARVLGRVDAGTLRGIVDDVLAEPA